MINKKAPEPAGQLMAHIFGILPARSENAACDKNNPRRKEKRSDLKTCPPHIFYRDVDISISSPLCISLHKNV
jgi:hypothetical protein